MPVKQPTKKEIQDAKLRIVERAKKWKNRKVTPGQLIKPPKQKVKK